ncbi:unnamed protein product [Allacma fusca]|uniref:C2H2-type domain-containing protein n=1 Tax=Allacma fusca TaxID=39272 RepID=A0A8J2J8Z3_9HEXA|nr:unnamed protein product [Allacma fusca]
MMEEVVSTFPNPKDEDDLELLQQFLIPDKDINEKIDNKCLVCLGRIVTDPGDIGKLQVELLQDLVKVFEISVAPFQSDLPSYLFCSACTGQIVDAVDLLGKIQSLYNDFEVIKRSLQSSLLGKWVDDNESGEDAVEQVRKTLVLGLSKNDTPTDANNSFSRLQMDQDPSSLSVRPDGDGDLDESNSLDILFPSITFNEDTLKERLRSAESSAKLFDVEARAEGDEGYQPEGADPGGEVPTTHIGTGLPGRRVTLQIGTKTSPVSESKPHRYYYNKEKKLVGFACLLCGRTMIREDYYTDSGEYQFKCFLDCCDKVLENFENLVDHHETSCLPMPQELNPKKRKVVASTRSGKITNISTATKNPDLVQSCPKSGSRVYDQNKKLISFTCSFCRRILLKEDYLTEEGKFIFKCFPDCCEKIIDNFNNLVTHHKSFCPSKPEQLYTKRRRCTKRSTVKSSADSKNILHAKRKSDGDYDLEDVKDKSLDILYPSISLTEDGANKRLRSATNPVKLDVESVEKSEAVEVYQCGDRAKINPNEEIPSPSHTKDFPNLVDSHEESFLDTTPDLLHENKEARGMPNSNGTSTVGTNNPHEQLKCKKSGTRVYDQNKKLASFTCPFCQRILLKEDYSTEGGAFIFKCFPDCCNKITDNFSNLVTHHESFCPSKPEQLHSKKRRITKTSVKVSHIGSSSVKKEEGHPSVKRMRKNPLNSNSALKADRVMVSKTGHRVYDSTNKLFSFGCPFCRKMLMREDYSTGTGKYVFKCLPECCGKTTNHFSNLVNHHESCCPSKPKQLYSKNRQKNKKKWKPPPTQKRVSMKQGFKYNAAHLVVGFKCPCCEKELVSSDFQTDDGNWIFKCRFESCGKVTNNFVNLAYHHGAHCLSRRKSTPTKSSSEKSNTVGTSPGSEKPFACTRCPCKYKVEKDLKFHMRLHYDEERTLKCTVCSKSFEGRTKLAEHRRTHRAEYKSCSSCPKVFLNQEDLDSHIAQDHNNTTQLSKGQAEPDSPHLQDMS